MSSSLKDQLMKAGLVTKKQTHAAKKGKPRGAQARVAKTQAQKQRDVELAALEAHKRENDRELNAQRQTQLKAREQADWVRQLIAAHGIRKQAPGPDDPAFNFKLSDAVHHFYVAGAQRKLLGSGAVGIVWFDGAYTLVPDVTAALLVEKIPKRVWRGTADKSEAPAVEDDPYADFVVPDDLVW
jgi:uncharacterized protein YaiL (DUF2058 family)